jgi:hypothetical protein
MMYWLLFVAFLLVGCGLHEGEKAKFAGVEVEGMAWRVECAKTTRAELDKRARRGLKAVIESPPELGPNPLLDALAPGDQLSKLELEEIFARPKAEPKFEWCNPLAFDVECRHVTEVIFDHYWASRELRGCPR